MAEGNSEKKLSKEELALRFVEQMKKEGCTIDPKLLLDDEFYEAAVNEALEKAKLEAEAEGLVYEPEKIKEGRTDFVLPKYG